MVCFGNGNKCFNAIFDLAKDANIYLSYKYHEFTIYYVYVIIYFFSSVYGKIKEPKIVQSRLRINVNLFRQDV